MAYKFQLGHAIMSGALDQDGDLLIKDEAGNVALSLEQDGDLSGSGDFEFGGSVKLLGTATAAATLAEDAMFYIDASDGLMKRDSFSNYADTAAGVGLGASGGVFSLDLNELGAASIAAGDSFGFVDATDGNASKKETVDDLATLFAGDGLIAASAVLAVQVSGAVHIDTDKVSITGSIAGDGLGYIGGVDSIQALKVNVDDSSIETNSDSLRIKADGVTDAMLNDDVATGLAGVGLGAASGVMSLDLHELTAVDIASGDFIGIVDSSDNSTKKDTVDDLATLFAGDGLIAASAVLAVQVSGAIHTNSDKVSITGSIAGPGLNYVGGVDSILGLEIDISEFSTATPAASDSFLSLDSDGATEQRVTTDALATLFAGDGLAASSAVMKLDINELTAATVDVSADSIAIVDANDGNASRKESIADLATAMAGAGVTATNGVFSVDVAGGDRVSVAAKATGATLAAGLNYHAAVQTGSVNYVLPAVASSENGDIVTVKGNSGTSETRFINIAPDSGDSIDGTANQNIRLESPSAAVQLIYVHADTNWRLV